jgi:hypothetical protein
MRNRGEQMRTLIAILSGAILAAVATQAQHAVISRAEANAQELVRLLQANQMALDTSVETFTNVFVRPALEESLKRELSPSDVGKAKAAVRRTLLEVFPPKVMDDATASILMKHFSAAEIESLIAFHATPLGAKFVQLQPVIAQEIGMTVEERWRGRSDEGYKLLLQEIEKEFAP